MSSGWQIGIDIGGTFTDVVAFHTENHDVRMAKVRSRPDDPVAGLLYAFEAVGIPWSEVDNLVHGTTMITNAIIENRLAKVALVSTEGFADTLAIGRQNRRYLYRLDLPPKSAPQIPQNLRLEIRERLDVEGKTLVEMTDEAIEECVREVLSSGVQAVAVSLLHAYANPIHEQVLGEHLRQTVPYVALSHQVNPEAREFERSSTTALSAGVMPLAAGYLDRLEEHRPKQSRLHLFHSAGGMAAPKVLRNLPLGLAFSGPAAGVAAACAIAKELSLDHAISFDMGGTTTDVCLIVEGRAEICSDRSLAGRPLRMPMVAVESIGAGGGSIARLDSGVLRVGPESAGADPGPACYGRGGTDPTVSDANLMLGYLVADRPISGGAKLHKDSAERALTPLIMRLGVSIMELALGIVRVANASMVRALRRVTVERGIDGRQCTLLAFGGAGPMHAVELARLFNMDRVIVPNFSSVFSAFGCLTADMSYTQQQTVRMSKTSWDQENLNQIRDSLTTRLHLSLESEGTDQTKISEVAAIRYSGQSYAVEVHEPELNDPESLSEQFRERHETLYGFSTDEPWELAALRFTAAVPREIRLGVQERKSVADATLENETMCWFTSDEPLPTPRYDRQHLNGGQRIAGPAIIEDEWSTVVLPPGATLLVDELGHLHIEVGEAL